ncbi:endospore germination permease [Neobacillus sp. MM2021_6]|uniref:GerAB/ArcD/ProY family transporter n=1 Tax=Bacillaceae TaxID=186817 RepID=UPI00140E0D67|nr:MULTISPECIES: endospore germination permease [Bacillaceae]MBO0959661.1 endospore germination permease [Neobacillus sp. MM2021_6]NHC19770.1 endospore germination permease [Bacillus sp. MM2020_4]
MNQKVIYAVHIYIILIMSTGFMVHVLSLSVLLSIAKRDSWLSVIFSAIPVTIWILFVFYIYKKLNNQDLISFIKNSFSNWVFVIFSAMFGAYFLFTAFMTLKFTAFWAKDNYTLDFPNYVVVLLFSLLCYYASAKGLRTIATMAFLILPFVTFFGFLVGLGNTPNKDYEQLFPLFEDGYTGFIKGIGYACASLFEVFFILFLTKDLTNKLKLKWLILVGLILVGLSFSPLAAAIAEFGSIESEKLRNPAYEEWKLLTLGHHITRLDFISVFQWLSGAYIRISLSLFIAGKVFSYKSEKWWVLPILYIILIVAACIPLDSTSFIYYMKKFYFPISLFFQIFIMLFLFLFTKIKGEKP